MKDLLNSHWLPVALLTGSNIFMTFAWYAHFLAAVAFTFLPKK